jgi:hypothetical protein
VVITLDEEKSLASLSRRDDILWSQINLVCQTSSRCGQFRTALERAFLVDLYRYSLSNFTVLQPSWLKHEKVSCEVRERERDIWLCRVCISFFLSPRGVLDWTEVIKVADTSQCLAFQIFGQFFASRKIFQNIRTGWQKDNKTTCRCVFTNSNVLVWSSNHHTHTGAVHTLHLSIFLVTGEIALSGECNLVIKKKEKYTE